MIFTATRNVQGVQLSFVWHGGEYIDITRAGMGHPSEVINVWDSYHDKPRIERTQGGLEDKVDEWIESYGPDALVHDATENW